MQFLSEQLDSRSKILALFLGWTLCLGMVTLSVQHSCNPMIDTPSVGCNQRVASNDGSGKSNDTSGQPEAKSEWKQPSEDITQPTQSLKISSKDSEDVPNTAQQKSGRDLIPTVAGVGSAAAAGVGASALTSAGVISTTVTVGSAVIATPVAVAVAAGILVFLAVKGFTRGA